MVSRIIMLLTAFLAQAVFTACGGPVGKAVVTGREKIAFSADRAQCEGGRDADVVRETDAAVSNAADDDAGITNDE